jgi:hypothetical protein
MSDLRNRTRLISEQPGGIIAVQFPEPQPASLILISVVVKTSEYLRLYFSNRPPTRTYVNSNAMIKYNLPGAHDPYTAEQA